MSALRDVFQERCSEVDQYFSLLKLIEREQCDLLFKHGRAQVRVPVRQEWIKTLKATSFLILYNLVEATVRDAITALYDKISKESMPIGDAKNEFIGIWVEQEFRLLDKYSASPRTYHELISRLVHETSGNSSLRIPADDLPISGNLDAATISKLCTKHGIPLKIPKIARGGTELSSIKRQRNDLAHGILSFEECGRQITVPELMQIRKECVSYLRALLSQLERFADAKHYRKAG
jgi:hypothetical protein